MKDFLLVGIGGAIGSVGRFGLARVLDRWLPALAFPPGILVVNVLGCLLIGLVLGAAGRVPEAMRLLLATGICGGFTTFSTFSHQALTLAGAGRLGAALLYLAASVALGLGATAAGLWLAR